MVDAPANPAVLEWARKERHLSPEDAADLLGVDTTKILALESGDEQPTVGFLRDMAKKYKVPFASLLMPEPLPPERRPVVTDYRTFDGHRPEFSLELQVALDQAWEQVDLLADVKATAPDLFPDSSQIPKIGPNADIEAVAAAERERIGFPIDVQIGLETDREAFLRWRAAVEEQGVFVHVKNLGGSDNCRGFAINDERGIPLIFLNSDEKKLGLDYKARIFGLFHEYCHIMMRQSAVSDHKRDNAIEARCNRFAAFFLMPRERFLLECQRLSIVDGHVSEFHVRKLSKLFKTSMGSVAIHAETLNVARAGTYASLLAEWRKRQRRSGRGIASHEEKLTNRYGVGYLNLVMTAADRGLLNKLDIFEMTDIKPQFLSAVESEVRSRKAAYGGR